MSWPQSLSMDENRKSGRPVELTDRQVDELLQALTDGAPLSSIVEGDDWPSYRSIFRRLEKDDEFRKRYERARAIQAERWADELITLANSLPEGATVEQIAAAKLQIDTLKWIIGKRLPRLYGDAPSSSVNITSSTHNYLVVTEERQKEIQERTRKLLTEK
jgi:hypothetical protein